jgi:hypothetical protein
MSMMPIDVSSKQSDKTLKKNRKMTMVISCQGCKNLLKVVVVFKAIGGGGGVIMSHCTITY